MDDLTAAINDEARKLIVRHEGYANWVSEENARRSRRSAQPLGSDRLKVLRPPHWDLARGFNPYLVRSSVHRIGHAIRTSLRDRSYAPRSPASFRVEKVTGYRTVSLFQIADSAVSRVFYRRLMAKNRPLLSARSYAYRRDLTAHDALQYIQSEWRSEGRFFVAEYDFSKYFERIDHDYIRKTLRDCRFLLTEKERFVIDAFLEASVPESTNYTERGGMSRERGVPQGTSLSLFLANVAATPLDRELERLGVGFVRYADDTLIWSKDYDQICRAVEALHSYAAQIGSELNLDKSKGIRLLVAAGEKTEMRSTDHVNFVGYRVEPGTLAMRGRSVKKLKQRLGSLLYENLLRLPELGHQEPSRLAGPIDKDFVIFILQARRYLYGDLEEEDLQRFRRGGVRLHRFKGAMAYYPLLDDDAQLLGLDRWLAHTTHAVMRKRAQLLRSQGYTTLPAPHGLDREALVQFSRQSRLAKGTIDVTLPSFRRIATTIRQAAAVHGPNRVAQGGTGYY